MLLQTDFVLIVSEWHVNGAIINRRWWRKRSVLVKYDSRWGRVSWQVTIFQPLIWSPNWRQRVPAQRRDDYIQVQGFDSTNSGWIFPARSSAPDTPPTPARPRGRTFPPRHVVSLLGLEQMPLKDLQASHVTMTTKKKGERKKNWSTSRNLKVMNHVVYYNNWNGSNWKHSPEYSRG